MSLFGVDIKPRKDDKGDELGAKKNDSKNQFNNEKR
jgi:hypothetical protein